MNYYREQYYKYLIEKESLEWYLKYWESKKHRMLIEDVLKNKLAVLQFKIEFCDDLATKQGLKEFKLKNHLKLSA